MTLCKKQKREWRREDGVAAFHLPSSILHPRLLWTMLASILACLLVQPAHAGVELPGSIGATAAKKPSRLNDVGIDQHLGAQIPPDLEFTDENGHAVRLGDYFSRSNRPIILTLVYYQCPMLCTMELNELVRTMNGMNTLVCGKDYDVLTISFNPHETPDLANRKRTAYLHEYAHKKEAAHAWHFMVGDEHNIEALTKAVGFRYKWEPKYQQYLHVTGLTVLTPAGKISKYFYGIDFNVTDLRLALVDASHKKVGSLADEILLFCCTYDPSTGKYTLTVLNLLKVGGALTLLALGGYLVVNFRRDLKNDHAVIRQQGRTG